MRNQWPGMSPRAMQHPTSGEVPLWQQHMYRQLQEMQRQQQLQQLDQGARQQNTPSQAVAKQAIASQLPVHLNGMPLSSASNFVWPNDITGGESKTASNSQMFIVGGMNGAQGRGSVVHGNGLIFANDQGQAMTSMGFVPQQIDQSLYGTPVSSSRDLLNQYAQFQGVSNNFVDVMAKAGGTQLEKTAMQSTPFNTFQNDQRVPEQALLHDGLLVAAQGFQGKTIFANAPAQSLNSGVMPGNFQQLNYPHQNVQTQEIQGRKNQNSLSGNLEEKATTHVRHSHGVTSLDPEEEKILYGTDDGSSWDASGIGGYLHGNSLESNDCFGAFHSGSWSALMQEAVQASSSDNGLQEEWSGLSIQKTEPSIVNPQATWDNNNNVQISSSTTLTPFPLFNDADSGLSSHSAPDSQHTSRAAYEQNGRAQNNASRESFQQSIKQAQDKHSDQVQKPNQISESGRQAQMQLNTIPNSVWAGHMSEQSVKTARSSDTEFNSHVSQWTHQQDVVLPNTSRESGTNPNLKDWTESLAHGVCNTLEAKDHAGRKLDADAQKSIHTEKEYDGNMSNVGGNHVNSAGSVELPGVSSQIRAEGSSRANYAAVMNSNTMEANQLMNQQIHNRHQVQYGKHVAFDPFVKFKGAENVGIFQHALSRGQQAWNSTINSFDGRSGDACMYEQEQSRVDSDDGYISNQSNPGQNADGVNAARENHLLVANDPSHKDNQKLGPFGWKTVGPSRFQHHQVGNSGMDVEPSNSPNHMSYFQCLPQSVAKELKGRQQGYIGHSQFAGHSMASVGKGHSTDFQRNIKGTEESLSGGTFPSYGSPVSASFDGKTAELSRNRTSQNMLELLHKVDQTRDNNSVAPFGFSERSTSHELPETVVSDGSASHREQHQSPAFQGFGFGLRLSPPSQRPLVSNHDLPSQTSPLDFSTRQCESESGDEDQVQLTSTASVQSLQPAHETSQSENWDGKSNSPGVTCKETPQSVNLGSVSAASAFYMGNQLQLQHQQRILQQRQMCSMTGRQVLDQPKNISFERQVDVKDPVRHASFLRRPPDSHDGAAVDQSAHISLPSMAGGNSHFRLAATADTRPPSSHFSSSGAGHSRHINADLHHINGSGHQVSMVETRSVSQVPATSGISQQVGFSTMLQNVFTNATVQQQLSGAQAHKFIPNVSQSIVLPTNRRGAHLEALQNEDKQGNKGGSVPSDHAACLVNSHQSAYGEETSVKGYSLQQTGTERGHIIPKTGDISIGKDQMQKHHSVGNSAVSGSSVVHLHQNDFSKGIHEHELFLKSHMNHVSFPNVASSNSDTGDHGCTTVPADVQQPTYSLLQQMQAMKGADSDMGRRAGKRLKGDVDSDASQMDPKAGQGYVYGQNAIFRLPTEGDRALSSQYSAPSDVKMLSFSLRENEEKRAGTPSQMVAREASSQDIYASSQHNAQNRTPPLSVDATSDFIGRNEHRQISPQLARSLVEHYGKYKNGQILAMYDDRGSLKAVPQQYFPAEVSRTDANSLVEQKFEANQFDTLGQSASPSTRSTYESSQLSSDITENDMILGPKKRKSATPDSVPWHEEVTIGSRMLQSISMAERDWAQATNRLIEKVEYEVETIEDGSSVPGARRRLILTTRLMQHLLSSVPAAILAAEGNSSYESVTYYLAKSVLGEACRVISCSGNDSSPHLDNGNRDFEKLETPEKAVDLFLSKVAEDFIERSRKLESDFSRLDKRTSFLDVRLECQELERFGVINRLGKFHGRSQADGGASSSMSQNASRKLYPQRYVTALCMPGNLPEGVPCLSL